jgi:hypothetical protein
MEKDYHAEREEGRGGDWDAFFFFKFQEKVLIIAFTIPHLPPNVKADCDGCNFFFGASDFSL